MIELIVNDDGTVSFNAIPQEAVCPVCGESIFWCLDMFSFTTGLGKPPFTLSHARCVWTAPAFRSQMEVVVKDDDVTR